MRGGKIYTFSARQEPGGGVYLATIRRLEAAGSPFTISV
jgi:hypothetical protein